MRGSAPVRVGCHGLYVFLIESLHRAAGGLLLRPAGHVPDRRGADGDPPAHQPVLGFAFHRTARDLPHAERLRPTEGPYGRGHTDPALGGCE